MNKKVKFPSSASYIEKRFGALTDEHIAYVKDLSRSKNDVDHETVLDIAEEYPDTRLLEYLVHLIDSSSWQVKHTTIERISFIGGEKAVRILENVIKKNREETIRVKAIECLPDTVSGIVPSVLLTILSSAIKHNKLSDPHVLSIIHFARKTRALRTEPYLLKILTEVPGEEVLLIKALIKALAEMRSSQTLNVIIGKLGHWTPETFSAVLYYLEKVNPYGAHKIVEQILSKDGFCDTKTKCKALVALGNLGGVKSVRDIGKYLPTDNISVFDTVVSVGSKHLDEDNFVEWVNELVSTGNLSKDELAIIAYHKLCLRDS